MVNSDPNKLTAQQLAKEVENIINHQSIWRNGLVDPKETKLENVRDGVRMIAVEIEFIRARQAAIMELLLEKGIYEK